MRVPSSASKFDRVVNEVVKGSQEFALAADTGDVADAERALKAKRVTRPRGPQVHPDEPAD